MTINCLDIEVECHVMSRCYARRFLSDDSFADFAVNFVKIQHLWGFIFDTHSLV